MENKEYKFLSPKISGGILPPESYLILNFNPLKKDLNEWIQNNKMDVSIYVLNLRDGASFGINEEKLYRAFSLNKLPLAILILKKVESGLLSLDTKMKIDLKDMDADYGVLYSKKVEEVSIRDLLRYLLFKSDDTAFNVLKKNATMKDLYNISRYLGYYGDDIDYNVTTDNIFKVSPKSVANLFISLYLSTILKPEYSEIILSDLIKTPFDIKKYAELPEDLVVSHKFAECYSEDESSFHDCGILYIGEKRIFYGVMTKGLEKRDAYDVVGSVVKTIYNYIIAMEKEKNFGL